MNLPRWTVFPALAVLAVLLITAFPHSPQDGYEDAPRLGESAAGGVLLPPAEHERVVVLGIDGLDPDVLEEVMRRFPERTTNFRWLASFNGVRSLGTSTPPQSPVAWSNFITGLDPGGHGIYDFIHRNPVTRAPLPSTTTVGDDPFRVGLWGDWRLSVPMPWHEASDTNRTGEAFWATLARHGVPADIWRMPANFPVIASRGVSFSGMLTPALDSAYGEFTFYTTDPPIDLDITGGRYVPVQERPAGVIHTKLTGPPNDFKKPSSPASTSSVPLRILIDREAGAAAVEVGDRAVVLRPGQWSDFLPVTFDLLPAGAMSMSGIVRFYLRSIEPEVELYASPVNIDPAAPVSPVSQPEDASAKLADRRHGGIGPYFTQGMAEEVNALKADVLTDQEFLDQSNLVYRERLAMMDYAIDRYLEKDEGGLLFFYYSTVDLCSHMLWRHGDLEHPAHDPEVAAQDISRFTPRGEGTLQDVVHDLYLKMDPVLARLRERLGDDVTLIVMSDHGFAPWRRKFSLNTWLWENGYLVLKEGSSKELPDDHPDFRKVDIFTQADWSKTRAYGVGFNGLYLNLRGREGDIPGTPENEAGIVDPADAPALLAELVERLEAVVDEQTGARVVLRADLASEVYRGARLAEAPDVVVGYDSGYGNSDPSTLGRVPHHVLQDNTGGTFNGNHLMAPEVVAGTLLANVPIRDGDHRLEDLTVEILSRYGVEPAPELQGHRVLATQP